MNIEDAILVSHVRATMGEVMTGAEQLRGLAQTLEGFGDLSARADPARRAQLIALAADASRLASWLVGYLLE